jgi:hypothetical protein
MTQETGCPTPCKVVALDVQASRLGRDEWRADIVPIYPQIFLPPKRLPDCREGWRSVTADAVHCVMCSLTSPEAFEV